MKNLQTTATPGLFDVEFGYMSQRTRTNIVVPKDSYGTSL